MQWSTLQRLIDGLELAPEEHQRLEAALAGAIPGTMTQPDTLPYLTWLPPDVPFFTGREEQLRELDQLIIRPRHQRSL